MGNRFESEGRCDEETVGVACAATGWSWVVEIGAVVVAVGSAPGC